MKETQENTTDLDFSFSIEVKGLSCPLPLYRAKRKLSCLSAGDILKINGLDKAFFQDFTEWCERNGHSLLEKKDYLGDLIVIVKKG